MTIVAVKAVPYYVMKEYLEAGSSLNIISRLLQSYDKLWIISITNHDITPLVRNDEWEDRMSLQFDDVTPKVDLVSGDLEFDSDFVYFNNNMAVEVCKFIREAHWDSPGSDLLVVNCHAGISRSGAVSDFARRVCGVSYEDWKRMNQQVIPNTWVKNLLDEEWGKMNQQ